MKTLEAYYKALEQVSDQPITNGRSYNHSDTELLDYLQKKYSEETGLSLDIREAIELLMEDKDVTNHNLWDTLSGKS